MARIDIKDFTDKDIARIFIASNIAEAELVENILTEIDIDYATELEPYMRTGFISGTECNLK